MMNNDRGSIRIEFRKEMFERIRIFCLRYALVFVVFALSIISVVSYVHYYRNGLGLAYNDARSHLDIGRRVVEGLKPGLAQLGSVWLPLTHLLMGLTIWNDFMWHSGLAGAIWSMIAFVGTGALIFLFLQELEVRLLGRMMGVIVFAANINILYFQSTAMTELMLLGTMTAGAYEYLRWYKTDRLVYLLRAAFWIMLSTLVRYDAWFLFLFAAGIMFLHVWYRKGYFAAEGTTVLFCTLAGFGIFLWFLWNQLIFKDAFYFAFGPYSAHAQQDQLSSAGVLPSKHNFLLSLKIYFYALVYNSGMFTVMLGVLGMIFLWIDKRLTPAVRIATVALTAPFFFNVVALYLGHSVLYVQGISGDTWFNVRYGLMLMPSLGIFIGYLIDRARPLRFVLIGLVLFTIFFSFTSGDAVTIDDARVGSSQKNVSEVSGWLGDHAKNEKGFVLISAASHDAIIFSSTLPMKKFIHEGTGAYWTSATENPDRWARWIIMRTYSDDDNTWRLVKKSSGFLKYDLVGHYPFADIYQLKPEYMNDLNTEPILGPQK
jgi:hypothetical protein